METNQIKVIAKLFNSDTRECEFKEATLLHWGISYEELTTGVAQYTVVFVVLEDGTVREVYPSNMKIINDESKQKLEAAAPEMYKALSALINSANLFFKNDCELVKQAELALIKATN